MARIIDLDEIIPENLTLRYRAVDYDVPGDPPLEYVLALWEASRRAQEELTLDEQVETMQGVHDHLLRVFQVCNPSLLHLPFGAAGLVAVSNVLFGMYGLLSTDAEEETPALDEDPSKAPASRRTKSQRSSGSRS